MSVGFEAPSVGLAPCVPLRIQSAFPAGSEGTRAHRPSRGARARRLPVTSPRRGRGGAAAARDAVRARRAWAAARWRRRRRRRWRRRSCRPRGRRSGWTSSGSGMCASSSAACSSCPSATPRWRPAGSGAGLLGLRASRLPAPGSAVGRRDGPTRLSPGARPRRLGVGGGSCLSGGQPRGREIPPGELPARPGLASSRLASRGGGQGGAAIAPCWPPARPGAAVAERRALPGSPPAGRRVPRNRSRRRGLVCACLSCVCRSPRYPRGKTC